MPVLKCSNGKWRIGTGPCMYTSKGSAESAYKGYLGSKYSNKLASDISQLEEKLATDYQQYKKDHPATKKSPSDPMFKKPMSEQEYKKKYNELWSQAETLPRPEAIKKT